MQSKIFKLLSISLFVFSVILFSSCEPDDPTAASKDWGGNWIIPDGIPPINQETSGTIIVDSDKQITISGELFGLNSSFKIVASVSSTKASFSTDGNYKINGTANLDSPSQITFIATVTENGNSETFTRKAIKR